MESELRAISLWQPHASLVALGVKPIETRSWATKYRGRLLIHAAATDRGGVLMAAVPALNAVGYCENPMCREVHGGGRLRPLPLGAFVATCTLIDVVPIIDRYSGVRSARDRVLTVDHTDGGLVVVTPDDLPVWRDVTDQRPYGDFTPGRYAWLLADVEALPEPIPARGRQGLWRVLLTSDSVKP